ncbi:MAG: inositol monophosphatase [Bacteroidales bacterium]|nr:inositol monophosphatase [Bacteroidales bacterium]
MIPEKAREICESALKKGGQVLMEHLGSTSKVVVKESISSVVTEADLASEKAILEILGNASGTFNIITEESGYMDNASSYTWVVDPLDGTSNFAAGLPWFGVIIALFREREPILGGMYLPVEDQLYFAAAGEGAWKNNRAIQCAGSGDLSELLVSYSFDFSDDPGKTRSEMEIMEKLSKKIRNIRSTNSLVDFCFTADGRLGAAINQTSKIWDIAVPWIMMREAGGMVTDITGAKIDFNLSGDVFNRNYTIVASGSGIHRQIIDIINT